MTETIRILIADDHKMVREGLRAFMAPTPGLEVVGEAGDGNEAVEQAVQLRPDVVLLDLVMPKKDGVEATREILERCPDSKVLIVSSFVEDPKVIEAIKAGASGYLLKDSSPLEIEAAIREIHKGGNAFPPRITSILIREFNKSEKTASKGDLLTERELEILKLVAEGLSNHEIASRLFLSVWTVRTYVATILDKLNVENRTQATLYALREGLVKLEK